MAHVEQPPARLWVAKTRVDRRGACDTTTHYATTKEALMEGVGRLPNPTVLWVGSYAIEETWQWVAAHVVPSP